MAQLSIAWVLQNPNVASALVGASRPEQIAANVKASGVKLDADVLTAIDDGARRRRRARPREDLRGLAEVASGLTFRPPTRRRRIGLTSEDSR